MSVSVRCSVTVRVLTFAQLRDRLGRGELSATLPAGSTGRDLAAWLEQQAAPLKSLVQVSRPAVNRAYADWSVELCDGDEVAIIPPVSGG